MVQVQQVKQEVAMFCPMICQENIQKGMGSSKNHAISLPERVNTSMFSLIIDYCRVHQVPGRSNKAFDEKYIRMGPKSSKSSRETVGAFEKFTDDPRIRLLNRLYARKRKRTSGKREIEVNLAFDKFALKALQRSRSDDRSVDELLSSLMENWREVKICEELNSDWLKETRVCFGQERRRVQFPLTEGFDKKISCMSLQFIPFKEPLNLMNGSLDQCCGSVPGGFLKFALTPKKIVLFSIPSLHHSRSLG
ncbi:unnamed protein product [Prunus armeniaca]|uniref:SKP1 component POZ domain-containing protein n=1 Tax=Prunus armeniaca TaxID=36596 RepID=A0A6J5U2Y2_PRUAR|nr:unnamed protein product [Prunus armeniaca]